MTGFDLVFPAPFCPLGIVLHAGAVGSVEIIENLLPQAPRTPLARRVEAELTAYFANPAHRFTLPLETDGTRFQQQVWKILQDIPAGTTLTYSEVAARLNSGARAVGNACRANPVPIIIPCHRVVARHGLGGYMGKAEYALEYKRWLLRHEGAH